MSAHSIQSDQSHAYFAAKADRLRKRQLAIIHIAKNQLRLEDADYQHILQTIAGKNSAGQLSALGLAKVIGHFQKLGFKSKTQTRPAAQYPQAQRIRALWQTLHQAGAVSDPSDRALEAYVKRQTGIQSLHWLNITQASRVIESLKKWQARLTTPAQIKA